MRLALAASLLAVLACPLRADPVNIHMRTPSHCTTAGGSVLDLPPGYFLDEPTRDRLDAEIRRLQEQETRLTAENRRLGDLTDDLPMRTLEAVGLALIVGLAAGVTVGALYF